jgi:hypothetical protein
MASKSKTLAELLNGDVTIDATDIADGSVTSAKLDTNIAIDGTLNVEGQSTFGTDTSGIINLKGGSSTSPQIRFFEGGTARARVGVPTGQTYLSLSGSDSLTADVVVNSSGNVGIGNTIPDSFYAGGNNLVVGTGSGSEGITIYGGNESNLFFADGTDIADNLRGRIEYSHLSENMKFYVNNSSAMTISSSGTVGIGSAETTVFNGVGGDMKFVVTGSDSTTTITNNSDAGIAIVNTDQTAGNLAGLHFARADTDNSPNYSGASIVAKFPDAQVTGQYPKGELSFLTSTAANNAPSEKMKIDSVGRVTMPYQPAFKQGVSNRTATGTDRVISGNNGDSFNFQTRDSHNVGSHWNSTTGRFTCPVAGTYIFYCSLMRNGNNGTLLENRIKKNGGLMYARAYADGYTAAYQQSMLVTTTVCAVGDYIEFFVQGTVSIYQDDSYIGGYFLG